MVCKITFKDVKSCLDYRDSIISLPENNNLMIMATKRITSYEFDYTFCSIDDICSSLACHETRINYEVVEGLSHLFYEIVIPFRILAPGKCRSFFNAFINFVKSSIVVLLYEKVSNIKSIVLDGSNCLFFRKRIIFRIENNTKGVKTWFVLDNALFKMNVLKRLIINLYECTLLLLHSYPKKLKTLPIPLFEGINDLLLLDNKGTVFNPFFSEHNYQHNLLEILKTKNNKAPIGYLLDPLLSDVDIALYTVPEIIKLSLVNAKGIPCRLIETSCFNERIPNFVGLNHMSILNYRMPNCNRRLKTYEYWDLCDELGIDYNHRLPLHNAIKYLQRLFDLRSLLSTIIKINPKYPFYEILTNCCYCLTENNYIISGFISYEVNVNNNTLFQLCPSCSSRVCVIEFEDSYGHYQYQT